MISRAVRYLDFEGGDIATKKKEVYVAYQEVYEFQNSSYLKKSII